MAGQISIILDASTTRFWLNSLTGKTINALDINGISAAAGIDVVVRTVHIGSLTLPV